MSARILSGYKTLVFRLNGGAVYFVHEGTGRVLELMNRDDEVIGYALERVSAATVDLFIPIRSVQLVEIHSHPPAPVEEKKEEVKTETEMTKDDASK